MPVAVLVPLTATPPTPTDDLSGLLTGLAVGDDAAFGELLDRFAARMFRVASAVLGRGRASDAEDAVQDVLVALVRAGESVRAIANLPAYLTTAVQRAAVRRGQARERQPRASVEAAVLESASVPVADAVDGDVSSALERALAALPDDQRQVVVLKLDGGLTFAEIAEALDVSPNTAASRYRYALDKIRTRLEDAGHGR